MGRADVARLAALFRTDVEAVLATLTPMAGSDVLARSAHAMISLAGHFGCAELVGRSQDLAAACRDRDAELARVTTPVILAAHRALAAVAGRYP